MQNEIFFKKYIYFFSIAEKFVDFAPIHRPRKQVTRHIQYLGHLLLH